MILKGFRFGMVLQLAVGPISIMVFQIAVSAGFLPALAGVAGAALVDALFVIAAILGVGTLLKQRKKATKYMGLFGAFVLILFGSAFCLESLGFSMIPGISIHTGSQDSAFLKVAIMTAANPLTIIFWAGVFATRIAQDQMTQVELYLFGVGAVLSTLLVQSLIAGLGTTISLFLTDSFMMALNLLAGLILIALGIKGLLPPESSVLTGGQNG